MFLGVVYKSWEVLFIVLHEFEKAYATFENIIIPPPAAVPRPDGTKRKISPGTTIAWLGPTLSPANSCNSLLSRQHTDKQTSCNILVFASHGSGQPRAESPQP